MDVLIAGCGWLGTEIGRALARRGERVFGMRRSPDREALAAIGIEARAADLADPSLADAAPERLDAIVACHAASTFDAEGYRTAYVEGNRALLALAASTGATRFVYTGSTGVFGQQDGSTVDEHTAPEPRGTTGPVLAEAEDLVLGASSGSLSTAVVRLSGLYGPGRYGVLDRVRRGVLALGPGDGAWMNWCHRDDAALAVIAALDRGRPGGLYHGSDAGPAPRRDVVRWIAARLGIEPPVGERPPRAANRRVDGAWTRRELGLELQYPTYRDGLEAAFTARD